MLVMEHNSLKVKVKGIIHPKIKIHYLSHHYADGGVGDVFDSTKHFVEFPG